jgi:hypothetical protein
VHILVTTTGKVDQQDLVFGQGRCQLAGVGQGMARFERRDDAFETAQVVKGLQRLGVVDADVLGAAAILEPGVLRANARIIEAGRNRMRLDDLAVFILQQIGPIAVQNARTPAVSEAACFPVAIPSPAASTPIRRTPATGI